jgi:CDP-glucose 4,6-dehydratase
MVINSDFWKGKKVFLTGNTGFKGSWITIWLLEMGAQVTGYSNEVPTDPSIFESAGLRSKINYIEADINDLNSLFDAVKNAQPDIVFHLAAQPLVRLSYKEPVETYETNIMGTVKILESIRRVETIKSVVMITTDKCYDNKEWEFGYREVDPMGGYDPYSSSKGAAELAISSYRNSFFKDSNTLLASARAGNVIGGGDWADDRLIPDLIRGASVGEKVKIRNPLAIRPWQHVLEPLSGYLLLAEKCYNGDNNVAEAWNFGPEIKDAKNVEWISELASDIWGGEKLWELDKDNHPHEATFLKLDISKAYQKLKWYPIWDAQKAVEKSIEWYKKFYQNGLNNTEVYQMCVSDINEYLN